MRVAVIFESSPFDRKGLFNAVHNRILHLKNAGECTVDAYCIHSRDNAIVRRIRHTQNVPYVETVNIDGILYRMLWYRFSIMDHLAVTRLHRPPVLFGRFMDAAASLLDGYDAIVAHSFTGALIARRSHQISGVPYFVTWHGSDVHTHPWKNPMILADTRLIMEDAACNFFVSRALMLASDKITEAARKEVLYNGVSDAFMRLSEEQRLSLRASYGLMPEEKVVAYVGNLVAVKNVPSLASVFAEVRRTYGGKVRFWIVGDGKMRSQAESALKSDDVRFFGNIPADRMPGLMNCIDVLVLPSLNEGLPLVCLEALKSGANAVGSDVGGIPEALGDENVVPLGDGFAEGMAARIVTMLEGTVVQEVPTVMDWTRTAAREIQVISEVSCSLEVEK